MKTRIILAALTLWMTAVGCGDQSEEFNDGSDSELQSLVGFPCQEYGLPITNNDNFVCTNVNLGSRRINLLYRLDGYNAAQKAKLKSSLDFAMQQYSNYWSAPANSPLLNCTVRNTSILKDPQGSTLSTSFTTTEKKVVWAITTLQFGFLFHVDNRQPIVLTAYDQGLDSQGSTSSARAKVGNDKLPNNTNMSFEVNRVALNQGPASAYDYSVNAFGGAIIHEMLHRKGYVHDQIGRSIGPLVYEFGNCITDVNHSPTKLTAGGKKMIPVD